MNRKPHRNCKNFIVMKFNANVPNQPHSVLDLCQKQKKKIGPLEVTFHTSDRFIEDKLDFL